MASDLKINKCNIKNFRDFEIYVSNFGINNPKYLKPPFYCDLAFCDYCILSRLETKELEKEIHYILFPKIKFEYGDFKKEKSIKNEDSNNGIIRRWKNAKCDVLMIWCHIWYKKDIFISLDNNKQTQNAL